MQVELKLKAYYVIDKTGYCIMEPGTHQRVWFRTEEEVNVYLKRTQAFTIFPNTPLSVVAVDINQVLNSDTVTDTAELVITSKILEDSLERMKTNYNEILKEYSPVRDLKNLIKNFEKHIGYNKLIDINATNLKEYVKDIVDIPNQPYYNQLIDNHFSKLQPKEDNPSFNIYKAFEDKKKEIEAAQNAKLFKEADKKKEDNSSFDIYSVMKRVLNADKDKDDEVSSINQYFVTYFKIYMLMDSSRVNAYHYDRYRQTKLQFETVSNILAEHTPTMAEHFHNLEELQDFAKQVIDTVFHVVYYPQAKDNKMSFDSYKHWIRSLTDREYESYFGVDVQFNHNEFTLSSPIIKQEITKDPRSYWRCFTNINNTLTWREENK